ncbi:Centromere/kinetochore Zw10 family protein [Aphelenchoides avenae]|nr:Centromere/kinetochore Zw10 family protein [Aphelenchus avenae]
MSDLIVENETAANTTVEHPNASSVEAWIHRFHDEITKGYEDVVRTFAGKYHNSAIAMRCQDEQLTKTIQYWVKRGPDMVARLERKLKDEEEKTGEKPDSTATAQLASIEVMGDHFRLLLQLETSMINLNEPNASASRVVSSMEDVGVVCEDLLREMTKLRVYDEEIAVSVRSELDLRHAELVLELERVYAGLIKFTLAPRSEPTCVQMVITVDESGTLPEALAALAQLGLLEEKLRVTADGIWKHFVAPLFHSRSPATFVDYSTDESGLHGAHRATFTAKAKYKRAGKPDTEAVLSALTQFFRTLSQALELVHVDETALISLIAGRFSDRLVNSLVADCLSPGIANVADESAFEEFVAQAENFENDMNQLGVFPSQALDGDVTSEVEDVPAPRLAAFLKEAERIFVDRKCLSYIERARDICLAPILSAKEVGQELSEERHCSESFEFEKCAINTSALEVIELIKEVLFEAAGASDASAAVRLTTTAQNAVKLYSSLTVRHHKEALRTVPHVAAVFYNGCHYIVHQLMTPVEVGKAQSEAPPKQCSFVEHVSQLRLTADGVLKEHLAYASGRISHAMAVPDAFLGLSKRNNAAKCRALMEQCVLQLEQTIKVWRKGMPRIVLRHASGTLVSHFLELLVGAALGTTAIDETDAQVLATMLSQTVARLNNIAEEDCEEALSRLGGKAYSRMSELIFCVNATFKEIGERWACGKGKLAQSLSADELKTLINARFELTDSRRDYLDSMF